jgi:hypothetical protein
MGWGVVTGLLTDTGNVLATYILGQSMMAGKKTYLFLDPTDAQIYKGKKVRHEFPNNIYIWMPNQDFGSRSALFLEAGSRSGSALK